MFDILFQLHGGGGVRVAQEGWMSEAVLYTVVSMLLLNLRSKINSDLSPTTVLDACRQA